MPFGERLEGGRGHVEPRKALVGRFKVGERVKSHFLFWGNCPFPWNGRVRWNGTCSVGFPDECRAVNAPGRDLCINLEYFG
jgi:hypothetical protein